MCNYILNSFPVVSTHCLNCAPEQQAIILRFVGFKLSLHLGVWGAEELRARRLD